MKLTPEQRKALKNNVPMDEVLAMTIGLGEPEKTDKPAAPEAPEASTGEQAAPEAGDVPTLDSLQASVADLTAKLGESNAKFETLTAEKATAEATVAELRAQLQGLQAGATAMASALTPYMARMSVALGKDFKAEAGANGADYVALAEAHAKLADQFASTYKAGRQSQGTPAATETKTVDYSMAEAAKLNF